MLNKYEITGRTRSHVQCCENPKFVAHPKAIEAFLKMREAALKDGFDLEPHSAFRPYERQLEIWNNKFLGKASIRDAKGNRRDSTTLTDREKVRYILDWSAIPGASRHHWGTDIDVTDFQITDTGYDPKLIPEEFDEKGPFYKLGCWLEENIEEFGFFRPYKQFSGGVQPEPWHLSYAPISLTIIETLSVDLLRSLIEESEILGKEFLLERLPEIHDRYILNYTKPNEL